jgi:DNA primase
VSGFYHRVLRESRKGGPARDYLEKRKIPSDVIEEFKLGYAPDGWDTLVKFLKKHNIPPSLAEKLGLVVKKQGGTVITTGSGTGLFSPYATWRGRS